MLRVVGRFALPSSKPLGNKIERHHARLSVLLLLLLFLSSVGFRQSDSREDLSLSKGKAGHIEVGMTIDSVYRRYERRLVQLVDLDSMGSFSPALEIYRETSGDDDDPSLVIEIDQSKDGEWIVWRITVYDSNFETVAGVGVTSTLRSLRKAHKVASIVSGEGGLYALVPDLGMSFGLDIPFADIPREWNETGNQSLIPDGTKVSVILVVNK